MVTEHFMALPHGSKLANVRRSKLTAKNCNTENRAGTKITREHKCQYECDCQRKARNSHRRSQCDVASNVVIGKLKLKNERSLFACTVPNVSENRMRDTSMPSLLHCSATRSKVSETDRVAVTVSIYIDGYSITHKCKKEPNDQYTYT